MALGESFPGVLAAAQQGAEWAWAKLYREYAGQVTGYLASRGASEPEDISSDVFVQVARKVHEFDGDENSFRSWLFVITHRRLIDDRRASGRQPEMTEFSEIAVADPETGDSEHEAIDHLTTLEITRIFNALTDGQRDVLALRIIGGLTLAETAEVLGKRVGAIKAIQHRGLEALRDLIDVEHVSQ